MLLKELHSLTNRYSVTIHTKYGERMVEAHVSSGDSVAETQFYAAYALTNRHLILEIQVNSNLQKGEVVYSPVILEIEEGQTYETIIKALKEAIDKIEEYNKSKFNLANEILRHCS